MNKIWEIFNQITLNSFNYSDWNDFTAKNLFKTLGVLGSIYFMYKTVKLHMKRKKYRHIPGPKADGYLIYN